MSQDHRWLGPVASRRYLVRAEARSPPASSNAASPVAGAPATNRSRGSRPSTAGRSAALSARAGLTRGCAATTSRGRRQRYQVARLSPSAAPAVRTPTGGARAWIAGRSWRPRARRRGRGCPAAPRVFFGPRSRPRPAAAPGGPAWRWRRHVRRCAAYRPSRRRRGPSGPGALQASAAARLRALSAAVQRRRLACSGTSGSGALGISPA